MQIISDHCVCILSKSI